MIKRRDPHTMDLLAWEPPQVAAPAGEAHAGRGALGNQIARLVSKTLRTARDDGKARADVARDLTKRLGRAISPGMLDKWASEAGEEHRIPLDAALALMEAAGDAEIAGFVCAQLGLVAVPARYETIIELHLIEEHEAQVAARKSALTARMRAK